MEAVGIHVFAGGFTQGIKRAGFTVKHQLETHNFGLETANKLCEIECINDAAANWPVVKATLAYGNPRCTGFSTMTSGYDESVHGPWAKCTQDIHQLCNYAVGKYDFIVWESVQQAATVGKPLLDYLVQSVFKPKNYRIAHLFLNAASFGNAQLRKRYFFVAYRDTYKFNVEPPTLPYYAQHVYDAIWDLRDRETHASTLEDYDENSFIDLSKDEWDVVPFLPNGWTLNTYARYACDLLPEPMRITYMMRKSDLPFSLHCINRLNWRYNCPTLHMSCNRFIHPCHNRPITVLEAARLMGWKDIPIGKNPFAQIAKGICPEVGEWLGNQIKLSASHSWGDDDFESCYNPKTAMWEGRDTTNELEKTFDLTQYINLKYEESRYDCPYQSHKFNVDPSTKRFIRTWSEVKQSYRRHNGTDRLGSKVNEADMQFSDE